MADRMTDQDLFDGWANTADPRLQAAMLALLKFGEVMREDGLPLGRDVTAFADLYGVPASALGGLVGLLPYRPTPSAQPVWVDMNRHPEMLRMVGPDRFARKALAAYGFRRAAMSVCRKALH